VEIYYSTIVESIRKGCVSSGSAVAGDASLAKAVQDATETAIYLLSLLDVERVRVRVEPMCAICFGRGTVPHETSRIRSKRCPSCKGEACKIESMEWTLTRPYGALLVPSFAVQAEHCHDCGAEQGYAHGPDCDVARSIAARSEV
jgi:hypothetical protein